MSIGDLRYHDPSKQQIVTRECAQQAADTIESLQAELLALVDTFNRAHETQRRQLKQASAERDRYREAFSHTHVAGEHNADRCRQCGLDIRDPIHTRQALNPKES